nr:ABC transporter ATP-binding protein [Mammaliicoccus sp. Marseille-Q6498]
MNNVLLVNNLNKYYGNNHILNDISFSLAKNEIVSILGRNGSGKTTLIESIFDLKIKRSGDITFFDFPINVYNNEIKKRIGIQLQVSELFTNQTVNEILETFNLIKGNTDNMQEIIHKFELDNITDKNIKSLSVGQKQRLKVCLAFLGNPSLVVLDEPTSGIDPQIRKKIWSNVLDLKKNEKSVLFTTHNMNEAHSYSDRVIILKDGKIVENASPKSLLIKYNKKNFEDVFIEITGENLREED